MLRADSLHVQRLCQLVQSAVQIIAKLHQVLDVVERGEEETQEMEELGLVCGERRGGAHLEQVSKVIPRVEGDPLDILVQYYPAYRQLLPKPPHVDTPRLNLGKVDPALFQKLDRVSRVHIIR